MTEPKTIRQHIESLTRPVSLRARIAYMLHLLEEITKQIEEIISGEQTLSEEEKQGIRNLSTIELRAQVMDIGNRTIPLAVKNMIYTPKIGGGDELETHTQSLETLRCALSILASNPRDTARKYYMLEVLGERSNQA